MLQPTLSIISLILANLVPIYGVLFLNWDLGNLLFIYWAESAIIGLSNIIKMLFAGPLTVKNQLAKLLAIPFFIIHYGGFMTGHLFFLLMVSTIVITKDLSAETNILTSLLQNLNQARPALIGLSISHGISLLTNYFFKNEWRHTTVIELFGQPYKRIFVMHITLLLGMFAMVLIGQSIVILLLFVGLKIFVDLRAHVNQHSPTAR